MEITGKNAILATGEEKKLVEKGEKKIPLFNLNEGPLPAKEKRPERASGNVAAVQFNQSEQFGFWQAWNKHRDYLKRLSMIWMNVSAADAEDAFSEATIRAYEKYGHHASQISNERAWFARLLHNICIDKYRANKRLRNLCERVREINSVDYSMFESNNLSPEGEVLNDELGCLLFDAIRDLPERLQRPVILRLVHGEEYDDIAKVLSITNDNARKRVQQGRCALRRKLMHLRAI